MYIRIYLVIIIIIIYIIYPVFYVTRALILKDELPVTARGAVGKHRQQK